MKRQTPISLILGNVAGKTEGRTVAMGHIKLLESLGIDPAGLQQTAESGRRIHPDVQPAALADASGRRGEL